ncbi:MAG: 6-bladed beta-propeller [Gemmatimonas sp.]|nr:6-bladed beta-propeller [Gemmatimonas sp.]
MPRAFLAWIGTFSVGCLVVAVAACSYSPRVPEVVRTDSAGVEIVISGPSDVELTWTLEPLLSLGGADDGPAAFYVVRPGRVGTDDAGHVYVLDVSRSQVVVFDTTGQHVRSFGGPGRGPGELSAPSSLAVAPDGSVAIFDLGKRGLIQFDGGGGPLPERPLLGGPTASGSRHIGFTSAGLVVGSMVPPVEGGTFRQALQLLRGDTTDIVAELSFPRPEMARYPSCDVGLNLPRIFEPDISWDANANTVAFSGSASYAVEVVEGDRPVRRVRRSLELRPASEADAVDELDGGFQINVGNGPCTIPPRAMVEKRGFAENIPWIEELVVSPSGELWIRRRTIESATDTKIDVFDPSGAYVGTLPSAAPFPLLFIGDNMIGAAEKDSTDVERLVLYRVGRE